MIILNPRDFWCVIPLGVASAQGHVYVLNWWKAKRLGIPHVWEDVT